MPLIENGRRVGHITVAHYGMGTYAYPDVEGEEALELIRKELGI